MAKSIKRISISTLDHISKEQFPNTITEQWFDNEIIIKRTLSLSEMLAFVDSAVSNCIYETGGYMPEIKEFVIRANILTMYANFKLPDNLEHCYQLVYELDAVETVLKHINRAQFDDILQAIDSKIEYLCDSNITAIEKQMQAVTTSFEDIQKKADEVFAGVSAGDISKLMSAINISEGVDEEKLVEAVFAHQTEADKGSDAE